MIHSSPSLISELVSYGYLFLFPAVVLEGPVATFLAGSVVALGNLNFPLTLLVVVVADVTGDTFLYWVGRFAQRGVRGKIGQMIGLTPEHLEAVKHHIDKRPAAFLVAGKASHGIGGPILIAAGAIKMPLPQFLIINTGATIIKSLLLLGLGYYFGASNLPFQAYLRYLALASFAAALYLSWRYGRRILSV